MKPRLSAFLKVDIVSSEQIRAARDAQKTATKEHWMTQTRHLFASSFCKETNNYLLYKSPWQDQASSQAILLIFGFLSPLGLSPSSRRSSRQSSCQLLPPPLPFPSLPPLPLPLLPPLLLFLPPRYIAKTPMQTLNPEILGWNDGSDKVVTGLQLPATEWLYG